MRKQMNPEMEKILGAPVGFDDRITGTFLVEGVEIIYFQDDGCKSDKDQFFAITKYSSPRSAKRGGSSLDGCSLTIPDGSVFHAIRYHGDMEGWRKDIEEAAEALKILLAKIDGNRIVISDGRAYDLSDCIPKLAWEHLLPKEDNC
jgi:hypothetical protein